MEHQVHGLNVRVERNKWGIFHYQVLDDGKVAREGACYPCKSAERAATIAAGNYRRERKLE